MKLKVKSYWPLVFMLGKQKNKAMTHHGFRMGFFYQFDTAKNPAWYEQNKWPKPLDCFALVTVILILFSQPVHQFISLHGFCKIIKDFVCSTGPYYCNRTVGQRAGRFIHSHCCGR